MVIEEEHGMCSMTRVVHPSWIPHPLKVLDAVYNSENVWPLDVR